MNSGEGSSSTARGFEVRISSADIDIIENMGSSIYGPMTHAKWRGRDVCLKSCRKGEETKSELKKQENMLWEEYSILRDLHTPCEDPYVVQFLGMVVDVPGEPKIVTEYMPDCCVRYLQWKPRVLTRSLKLRIALDGAIALQHLHDKNRVGIDFVYTNLLLNLSAGIVQKCKLGDITLFNAERMPGYDRSLRWTAPELLGNNNGSVGSKKADIYAYGIMMWEICTGQFPHSDMNDKAIYVGVMRDGLRPSTANLGDPEWTTLMEQCWSDEPENRPASFNEIAGKLKAMWNAA